MPQDERARQPAEPIPTDPDDGELVGPGRYRLRIQPAAAIQPGEADARRLLRIWFVRKSFYWLFFLGWMIGAIAATARREQPEFDLENGVAAPWLVLALAFALRFVTGWVALGLAYPMAIAHEPNLSPRTNFGHSIGIFFDRLNVARAFRALRWTHHVREVALRRLGERGRKLARLDPILDLVNNSFGVLAFVTLVVVVRRESA